VQYEGGEYVFDFNSFGPLGSHAKPLIRFLDWLRSRSASNSSPCRLATGGGGRRAFLANGDVAEERVNAAARNQR